MVAVNICQNGGGKQTTNGISARGTARERSPDRARGDRLRRHGDAKDRSTERTLQAHRIGGEPALPLRLQCRRQLRRIERRSRTLDDQKMREREKLLPAALRFESGESV